MKTNRFLSFIASIAALSFATTACEEEKEDLGAPSVEVGQSEVSFEQAGGETTVQLTATRDWKATTEQDWISIDPREGDASSKAVTIEIKVNENTGLDREGSVKFDIGFDSKTLTVKQKGSGSAEDMIVYKNDFDKEEAKKTFGTGTSWPYLDQFEGWKNATGTGVGSEVYSYKAMSARANSTSNSNYSDYEGSGVNNLFFGSSAYFSVTGIKLPSSVNYSLTFGTEKYNQDNGSLFKHDEFHVYITNDGKKWVELEYSFPNGDKEGRWDLATSNFTVPSGTTSLGIYVKADVASSYRLDDLCLSIASAAGTIIDFSKGIDLGEGGSDTPGSDYDKAESKTVKDFIATASTSTYYKLKGKVSRFNSQYCSFDLTDETGTIYVYSVDDETKSSFSDKIKDGGTVELAGVYKKYNDKDEVVNAHILSYSAGDDTPDVPGTKMTLAQMLTVADDTAVESEEVLVGAVTTRGYVVTDGTSSIYVYHNSTPEAKVGDKVKFSGTKTTYYGLPEITSPKTTVVSSGNEVKYPNAKDITSSFDSYSANVAEYVTYKATVVKNGNYTNFKVEGASKLQGALSSAPSSVYSEFAEGDKVQVTGFFNTINTTSNLLNVIVTEVKVIEKGEGGGDNPGGDTPDEGAYASNVKWTLGANAYDNTSSGNSKQSAKINGVKVSNILKLGTTSKAGVATLTIPANTTKVSFYAVAWNGKTATLTASLAGTVVGTQTVAGNAGATGNPEYTLTVTDSDHYSFSLPAQSSDIKVDITTTEAIRVILFGIKAE